jgi:Zn-dependent protease
MKILVVLAAVFAVLRLLGPLLVLNRVLRVRLWKPRLRLAAADDEVPSHVRDGLREGIEEIERLGFEPLGWMALEREGVRDDVPRYQARLFHPGARAYAALMFSSAPDPVAPWSATFMTFGAGDRVVRTYDGVDRPLLGEPPGTIAVTPFAATIEQQWEAHRAAAIDLVPADLDHDAAFALSRDRDREQFDALVRGGEALPAGGPSYRFSWRLALRVTRQVLSGGARVQSQRRRREALRRAAQGPAPQIPVEEEYAAYQRILDASSGPPRASFLAALFVVTLALFVVAGWYASGTATTAAIVLAVVLFHELGHYLAMRAFGYVDTSIFFIPFLGGVAVGRKDGATLGQRMIVLFAGPLPGLLLAIAVAMIHPPSGPQLREAVEILVVVNLFNLLPILPLDGGQIAHMLLFSRRPWLDVASRAVAAAGLIFLAWTSSAVFLGVLGAIVALQLPGALRVSRLRRQLQEARTTWPGETPVSLLFRVLPATPFARASFAEKVAVARAALAQPALDAPLRARDVLGGLSAYATVLGVGCVALMMSFTASAGTMPPRPALHVEAEAPLACSVQANPEPLPDTPPATAALRGIAMFRSPEALAAARAQVVAALPDGILRSVGPVLFVWTVPDLQADGDGPGDQARWAEDARRVEAAVTAAGARAYAPGKTTPVIECAAPDQATAGSIDDALEDFVALRRNAVEVRAPWSGTEGPTPGQALARSTFRIAMAARDAVQWDPPRRSLWSIVMRTRRKNAGGELREEQARAVEAALAAARAAQPIDEQVARLVLAKIAGPSSDERVIDAELRRRLGAVAMWGGSVLPLVSGASRAGASVRAELSYVDPGDVDRELGPLLRWSCARSCQTRILLETR